MYEQQISFAQLRSEYTRYRRTSNCEEQHMDRRLKNQTKPFFSKKGRICMKETFQILGVSSVVPSSLLKGPVLSKQPPVG